jgi:hypothetical protein
MNRVAQPELPRRRIWQIFGIAWAILIVLLGAWSAFVGSRTHPFRKSYDLGVDEVDERHELSWLAWGHYGVRAHTFDGGGGVGGDIAVEIVNGSGEVIVPRKFLFGERAMSAGGQMEGTPRGAMTYAVGPFSFETGLFDRYTLRVTTVKSEQQPPRTVDLTVAGIDAWAAGESLMWGLMLVAVIFVVSAVVLAVLVRVIAGGSASTHSART